jgi:hypothetical protein
VNVGGRNVEIFGNRVQLIGGVGPIAPRRPTAARSTPAALPEIRVGGGRNINRWRDFMRAFAGHLARACLKVAETSAPVQIRDR